MQIKILSKRTQLSYQLVDTAKAVEPETIKRFENELVQVYSKISQAKYHFEFKSLADQPISVSFRLKNVSNLQVDETEWSFTLASGQVETKHVDLADVTKETQVKFKCQTKKLT